MAAGCLAEGMNAIAVEGTGVCQGGRGGQGAVLLLAARFALPKNAAKEVAYSDLLAGLRAGAVTVVAFEEESHRIYFHRVVDDGGGGKDVDTGASEACRSAAEARWPCYARSVPHDEGFLLGLMRDGGADYRSVPRLAAGRLLVDMLNTLLTLWEEWRRRASAVMIGEAAGEGVIFTYRVSYSSAAEAIVNDVCRYYHMDARESVWDYLRDTMIGCEEDPSFARGRNMVTYAVEQVESSSSPDGYLSGLRILSTLVGEIASSYACTTTHVEQHRMIKHMLISRHHVVMLKLIQTLEPRGPHDAEARERATVIVAYIAGGVHLERLPRALCCVTSLLDDEYRLAEPYDRDLVLEKLQLRPPPCPDEEVEFVEMYRLVYEREPPHLSLEKYKNLVVQGQRILGKLAADEDNCRIMSDTRGLLVSVPFQDSRVKLRRQITSCKPAISTMESILRCDGCDAELRRLAAQLLTVLSLDKSSGGMSSENIQGLIRILTDIFVHDSKRSSVRKCAGEELVKLSLESESNASIILKLKLNDSIVVDRLSEMVVDVEDNTFRTSAADILKHLCINHTTDDEHWDKLKNSMTIAIPKVLRELLGCDWRRPERQTVATQANNSGNFSPPDADIEALPDGDPSRVSNGGNNASSCSNQQNGKQYTPEEIEVQEALASLCVTVCDKLISTDPVLADRFDKIAADVCLDSSITANTTANTAFAALVKEAGEVVEKRKAQSIVGIAPAQLVR
ncbi:hypothetical protein OsJ_36422 [Oryza sativa Japonica Group]|uniref:Uncharacterized protein n=1 Tax=Oryza sativa subsp. japonica TaxID=39947 RepID=B9GDM1_ORYSJ|nr:hypothetical protein OsJ_36422 [Oryza sativa Japonica Group]